MRKNLTGIVIMMLAIGYAIRYPWPREAGTLINLLALLVFTAAVTLTVTNIIDRRRNPRACKDQN